MYFFVVQEDVEFMPTSDHDVVNALLDYYKDIPDAHEPAEHMQNPSDAGFVHPASNHIYVPDGRYISINDSEPFLSDESVGSDNPVFMGDEYGPSAGSQNGFQIEYKKFPENVLKVQVCL